MSAIGFVVWGIRNGFKNNWLAAHVDADVYQFLTDDMRQICNSTVDVFYSIEKIQDYTLLSIFNPNTKDHVQRKAYMAMSIVLPNGCFLSGNVLEVLKSMMQTYEIKQGNAMVNMVSAEDIKVPLKSLQLSVNPNTFPHKRTKIGLFQYNSESEIQSHFQDPSIYEFKKVFFISGQNVALEKMQGIEHVNTFSKPMFLTVSDFDPKYFSITINNQPISAVKSTIKQGDLIQFVDRKTKQGKQMQVGASDVRVSMIELFPPIFNPPKPPKPPKRGKSNFIIIGSLLFCLLAGAAYFFLPSSPIPVQDIDIEGQSSHPDKKRIAATYNFETLELKNLPNNAHSATWFYIYKLSNVTVAIDSFNIKKTTLTVKTLKKASDTLILVKYQINDKQFLDTIPLEFVVPSTYTIKSGEALSKIAERFDIKKDSLMKWNNIINENSIKEGQELKLLPNSSAPTHNGETASPNGNPIKENNTTTREKPKPTQQPVPAAGTPPKDNVNDLTQLKKEADKLIKELKQMGVVITSFENIKNSCQDQACLKGLIENMKKEKQKNE
jgi:LysM repeat protein